MPSGDGIDLIKHIKDACDTPVIMLTAMGEDNSKIQEILKKQQHNRKLDIFYILKGRNNLLPLSPKL